MRWPWRRTNVPGRGPAPTTPPRSNSSLTTDRNDPRLTHGPDTERTGLAPVYLVLSEEERAEGFVRPVRRTYVHVGRPGPRYLLYDLTAEQTERYEKYGYVKWEPYPDDPESSVTGRFWTQDQLDSIGRGCGVATTMGDAIAETYARNPYFYGATYCVGCQMHLPVGPDGEFVWDWTDERVGT